jgi:prepilin-type N-terminal cleavage/methylation domain-containing protein
MNAQSRRGFTLVELLAVVAIICVLVGAILGVAKYANRQTSVSRARAQMATLQTAIEMYKADVGYYPASTIVRFSGSGSAELSNSWLLYRALTQPKLYYNATKLDIASGSIVDYTTNQATVPVRNVTYFKDPWGQPWNYYRPNPPQSASLILTNVCGSWPVGPFFASSAIGGQMNSASFDLFSFGPDGCTWIPGSAAGGCSYAWRWYGDQTQPQHATDDINNWGR